MEVADALGSTLDLDTSLRKVAELVRKAIDYQIFAIFLLNEKMQELRIRFQVGHAADVAERIRVKVGEGATGIAAQIREAVLVTDFAASSQYIATAPNLHSQLAVPLIHKTG